MKFSQRIGQTPLTKKLQIESIDEELKNGLWNIYDIFILNGISTEYSYQWGVEPSTFFSRCLWLNYFKKPVDRIPNYFSGVRSYIREYFFSCSWFQIYDLVESSIDIIKDNHFEIQLDELFENFNRILEREFAGYRFIEGRLSPITNQTELKEIEEALTMTGNFTSFKGSNTHLREALTKLSDRQNPDYRNSIKESICAIESLAKIISEGAKDSLGASLDKIKGKLKIHSALEKGFKQIYGYTSDSDGIRHALTEETTCDFEDAKFMLVSCSAFINYLVAKANKAGIVLS